MEIQEAEEDDVALDRTKSTGGSTLDIDDAMIQKLIRYRIARLSEEYGGKSRSQLYKVWNEIKPGLLFMVY